MTLHTGDCIEVMAGMPAESVDAIVTDPPYGLEFMGKEWDSLNGAGFHAPKDEGRTFSNESGHMFDNLKSLPRFGKSTAMQAWHEAWAREAFRVAKPGAHLIAAGGTRTYHRLACAIEDAGWEIRDCLVWAHSQGFPKGLRPVPKMWETTLKCQSSASAPLAVQTSRSTRVLFGEAREPIVLALARILPGGEPALLTATGEGDDSSVPMVTLLSEFEGSRAATALNMTSSWKDSLVVGYDEVSTSTTETTSRRITDPKTLSFLTGLLTTEPIPIAPSSATLANGSLWPATTAVRRSSDGSLSTSVIPMLTVLGPATWNPIVRFRGYNVALKPAWEPWVLARKPLRGTVAQTVTQYGTGALNIDASRIPGTEAQEYTVKRLKPGATLNKTGGNWRPDEGIEYHGETKAGRWPANVILTDPIFDGDVEGVVGGGQTSTHSTGRNAPADYGDDGVVGWRSSTHEPYEGDTGTYSRFFLIPKSSRADREPVVRGQLEERESVSLKANTTLPNEFQDKFRRSARANSHPTVKPVELMRHLVRLVTPPGGTVLDCFAGSGSTLIAAEQEGFAWIGIEKEPEYVAIAEARLHGTQRGLGLDVGAPTRKRSGQSGWRDSDRPKGAEGVTKSFGAGSVTGRHYDGPRRSVRKAAPSPAIPKSVWPEEVA